MSALSLPASAPAGIRRWLPPARDWVVPAVVAVIAQVDVWPPARLSLGHLVGPRSVVAGLYIVTSLALAWRRLAPVPVLALIVSLDAVEYLAFGAPEGLGSFLPTVVAVYAVGRYARAQALAAAGPLALLGIVVHELTDPIFQLSGSEAVFYGIVAAMWPLGWMFQQRAAQATSLQRQAQEARAASRQVAEGAVAEERARIARELHDIVGHGLSVVVLQLVAAQALLERSRTDQTAATLERSERMARETLLEMRRLLDLVNDAPEPQAEADGRPCGLKDLDRLVDDARLAGAPVAVTITGHVTELPPGLDLTAYRIVQECLTNVLRHATPRACTVTIEYVADRLLLTVRNTCSETGAITAGRGLAGMRERAQVFGGTLEYARSPEGTFTVAVVLPVTR